MAHNYDERPRTSDGPRSRHGHHHHHTGRRSRDNSPDHSRLRADDRYNSSRTAYGQSLPSSRPQTPRVPYPSARPPPQRKTWPPAPKVEDEKVSLAKEANPPSLADSDRSEARSRGTLEQQPIILDAYDPSSDLEAGYGVQSKHFGSDSRGNRRKNTGDTLHPLGNAGRAGGRRRETPRLDGELPTTPDLTRREPSPYAFNPKVPPTTSKNSSSDSGYFSSSDIRTSAPTTPTSEKPKPGFESDALRGKGKARDSLGSTPKTADIPEDSLDDLSEVSSGSQGSRNASRYSFVKSDLTEQDYKTSLRETIGNNAQQRLAEVKSEAKSPRRSSDSTSTMQLPRFDNMTSKSAQRDTTTRPAPLPTSAVRSGSGDYVGTTGSGRSSGSRPSSPVLPSPPRSPRASISHDSQASGRTSKQSSTSSSRPSSPVQNAAPTRFDETIRRSSTFPIVQDDRSQRTSRLATSTVPSDMRSPSPRPPTHGPSLPYPVDDMNLMPSEEDHRYRPRALGDPFVPHLPMEPESKRSSVSSRPASIEIPRSRPPVDSRHTVAGGLPTLATATGISDLRLEGSPTTARDSTVSWKNLAPCPRSHSSRNHDDWYTLDGCPNFDMCPSCFESNFAKTSFKDYFRHSPRADTSQKVKCNFSSPWMRLAWTLTVMQRRYDLELLYEMARIEHSEQPCPGGTLEVRNWHTLLDERRHEIRNFDLCPCDVKKLESLMPNLSGYFVRGRAAGRKRKCDFRVDSPRFAEYMDILTEIDSTASLNRKRPAIGPFIELASHKAQMRECSRDDLVHDQTWHFVPQLPEFTVCEECYSCVIWPAIAEGSSVANRFHQTPLPVHEEKSNRNSVGVAPPSGTSCQLYSARMRKVFRKAVETGDFNYLVRRARERKDVEMELQSRFAGLRQVASEVSKGSGSSNKAGDRSSWDSQQRLAGLKMEFDKMMAEWKRWE